MEIRTNDGQVMFESEFRQYIQQNGGGTWNITTPEILASLGAVALLEGPQASPTTHYQYSMRDGVEQIDGQWFTKYSLGPIFTDRVATETEPAMTAAEQESVYKATKDTDQAKSVRTQRDDKLKATDWRFRSDMNPSQAWIDYCQALRDLPSATGFPWDMEWPTEP
jgi:hypothetical protein